MQGCLGMRESLPNICVYLIKYQEIIYIYICDIYCSIHIIELLLLMMYLNKTFNNNDNNIHILTHTYTHIHI